MSQAWFSTGDGRQYDFSRLTPLAVVKAAQGRLNVTADGVVGPGTLSALRSKFVAEFNAIDPNDASKGFWRNLLFSAGNEIAAIRPGSALGNATWTLMTLSGLNVLLAGSSPSFAESFATGFTIAGGSPIYGAPPAAQPPAAQPPAAQPPAAQPPAAQPPAAQPPAPQPATLNGLSVAGASTSMVDGFSQTYANNKVAFWVGGGLLVAGAATLVWMAAKRSGESDA